jgi:DNA mismatch endonuclease Vsr
VTRLPHLGPPAHPAPEAAVAIPGPDAGSSSWATSPSVRAVMQGNRKRGTRPELALRQALRHLGIHYRLGRRPLVGRMGTPDLLLHAGRMAIFIDGCFWHACPDHVSAPASHQEYWGPKIERNRIRDMEVNEMLAAAGWTVVRVWEHESPDVAARKIADVLDGNGKGTSTHRTNSASPHQNGEQSSIRGAKSSSQESRPDPERRADSRYLGWQS